MKATSEQAFEAYTEETLARMLWESVSNELWDKKQAHARMQKHVQPAVDRFRLLDEDKKELFYGKLTAYVSFYSFISQILPYSDSELEMLYSYRISRTCNDIVKETESAKEWSGFPQNAISIGENGYGDQRPRNDYFYFLKEAHHDC